MSQPLQLIPFNNLSHLSAHGPLSPSVSSTLGTLSLREAQVLDPHKDFFLLNWVCICMCVHEHNGMCVNACMQKCATYAWQGSVSGWSCKRKYPGLHISQWAPIVLLPQCIHTALSSVCDPLDTQRVTYTMKHPYETIYSNNRASHDAWAWTVTFFANYHHQTSNLKMKQLFNNYLEYEAKQEHKTYMITRLNSK